MLLAAILRLARVIRWRIVTSGTRKARAISEACSPPSSRNVSATCASGARAGWQQVKINRSRSSTIDASSKASSSNGSWLWSVIVARCSRLARVDSRRRRSRARLRAVTVIHAPGLGGRPVSGQRWVATTNASWTDSSARSMLPRSRTRPATTRPYSSRNTRAIASDVRSAIRPLQSDFGVVLEGTHLDRAAACHRGLLGPPQRLVEVVGLDDPEAADVLLRLQVGAVGGDDVAAVGAHDGRRVGRVQAAAEHPHALLHHLLVDLVDVGVDLLDVEVARQLRGVVSVNGQQIHSHCSLLCSCGRHRTYPTLTQRTTRPRCDSREQKYANGRFTRPGCGLSRRSACLRPSRRRARAPPACSGRWRRAS